MKKLLIGLSALLVLFISGCTRSYPVDEIALKKIVVKSKSYKKSKFLVMNTCYMGHITSKQIESEIKRPSRYLIGRKPTTHFESGFVIANCALTDKQFIAYYTKEKGKKFAPLIFLDYKDINGAGIETSDAFGFGYQLQLKTKKGVFGIILQNYDGFEKFDMGSESKKYLKILKAHGVKDFKLPKRLHLRNSPYINNMLLVTGIYYPSPNIPFLEEACDLNNGRACNNLGVLSVRRQDYSKAKKYFRKGCDLGDDKACGFHKELISNPIEFYKKVQ